MIVTVGGGGVALGGRWLGKEHLEAQPGLDWTDPQLLLLLHLFERATDLQVTI